MFTLRKEYSFLMLSMSSENIIKKLNKPRDEINLPVIENVDKLKNDVVNLIKRNDHIHYNEKEAIGDNNDLLVGNVPIVTTEENELDRELSKVRYLKKKFDKQDVIFQGVDPLRYVPIFEQRHRELENKQFQKFLLNTVDPNDPYAIAKLQDLFPEIWEQRERQIDLEAEKYRKLASLNLKGKADTADEFILLYNIGNGLIEYDADVLKQVMGLDNIKDNIQTSADRFKKGILNYTKYKKYALDKISNKIDILRPFNANGELNFKKDNANDIIKIYTPSALTQMKDTSTTIANLYT